MLLDACTLLWWTNQPELLSPYAYEVLENGDNQLFLSVASIWEIVIKVQTKKLKLLHPPQEFFGSQIESLGLQRLNIQESHVLAIQDLPMLHKDPFDRLLIAQSKVENLPILTPDAMIAKYPIKVIW